MRVHLAIGRLLRLTAFDPAPGGCWRAVGCWHDKWGYARFCGKFLHRWAWMTWKGPIPSSLLVLHRCDVPDCWRPSHLYLGTHGDNNRDCYARGRRERRWGFYWGDPGKPVPNRHQRLS